MPMLYTIGQSIDRHIISKLNIVTFIHCPWSYWSRYCRLLTFLVNHTRRMNRLMMNDARTCMHADAPHE